MEQDHDRIIRLEERDRALEEKIDKIMTNHLPHIQDKVDKIEDKLALWSGAIIIIGIIAPYILEKILK